MKNFLFAIFAFASLMASGMASPFGNGNTGLEAREGPDYSSHGQIIRGLLQEVSLQTDQMNKSISSAPSSLAEEDRKELAKQLDEHVRNITLLLKQARSTKANKDKRGSLDSLDSRAETCSQQCIYDMFYELVYEVYCTANHIISTLGLEAVIDYLTPMIMALLQLLVYWEASVPGLVVVVKDIINAIFVALGVPIVAVVVG